MPISSNKIKKIRGALMLVGAACFFLGVVAYWYTDGFYFPSEPAPLPPPKTSMPKTDNAKRVVPTEPLNTTSTVTPEIAVKPEVPAPSLSIDAGNVGAFSGKQAALEEIKLDVAIEEQKAKLKELREGKPAPQSVVQPVPQPVAVLPGALPPELPPLPPLATAPHGELPVLPSGPVSSRRTSGLMAVQGVDGNLSAVFTTANGKKTVRVGDALMGSRVRAISLDGVTLASGKTITIED